MKEKNMLICLMSISFVMLTVAVLAVYESEPINKVKQVAKKTVQQAGESIQSAAKNAMDYLGDKV